MTKVMIEIEGGAVVNLEATDDIQIYVVDHDNLEAGDKEVLEDSRIAFRPFYVATDDEDFMSRLEDTLETFKERMEEIEEEKDES